MCGNCVFLISISYSSAIGVPTKLPDSSTAKYWLLLGADHRAGQVSCLGVIPHIRCVLPTVLSQEVC